MGGLVVQPQWELREDTLGDVRGVVDLVLLAEDRDVGDIADAAGQGERSVTTQEETRRGRDRQHWAWRSWEGGRVPGRKRRI